MGGLCHKPMALGERVGHVGAGYPSQIMIGLAGKEEDLRGSENRLTKVARWGSSFLSAIYPEEVYLSS